MNNLILIILKILFLNKCKIKQLTSNNISNFGRFNYKEQKVFNKEFDKKTLMLLWECCQIPDFVKKTYGNHFEVIGNVFKFLTSKKGLISEDYMRLQLMNG